MPGGATWGSSKSFGMRGRGVPGGEVGDRRHSGFCEENRCGKANVPPDHGPAPGLTRQTCMSQRAPSPPRHHPRRRPMWMPRRPTLTSPGPASSVLSAARGKTRPLARLHAQPGGRQPGVHSAQEATSQATPTRCPPDRAQRSAADRPAPEPRPVGKQVTLAPTTASPGESRVPAQTAGSRPPGEPCAPHPTAAASHSSRSKARLLLPNTPARGNGWRCTQPGRNIRVLIIA